MKYLKKFFTQNEYGEFVESDKFIKPHVSYITENKKVNFHKKPKSPYVPDGNATIIAKFHAGLGGYGYNGLTNGCGIKSLKVDGVKIDREFPMPIVETMEVKAEDMYLYTNASGETCVGTHGTYKLFENLMPDDMDTTTALLSTMIYLKPSDPDFDIKKVTNVAVISDKEDKASMYPLNLLEYLSVYLHPLNNKICVDTSGEMGLMLFMALLPNGFALSYVDEETNEIVFLDTTHEIHKCYDKSIYNASESSLTPVVVFEEVEAEHTLEIELNTNDIPPCMFIECCITGISCNVPLNTIGSCAFSLTPLSNVSLNGVKEIKGMAFGPLEYLTNVDMSGCEVLSAGVFADSPCMSEVTIPDTMKYMAAGSLDYMEALTKVTFQGKVAPVFNVIAEEDQLVGNVPFRQEAPASGGTIYIPRNADMSTYEIWVEYFDMGGWTYELY